MNMGGGGGIPIFEAKSLWSQGGLPKYMKGLSNLVIPIQRGTELGA